jgi:hypothetical protein
MDRRNDGGKVPLPDLRRLTDRQLGALMKRAREEWLERLHFAVYGRGLQVDPMLVADAMLRRGLWRERA